MPKPDWTACHGMVLIPASQFSMGSQKKSRLLSQPRTVRLDPFYMDIYPVTHAEYARVTPGWEFDPERSNYPATGLSLDEIHRYCSTTGKRLPTEEEWERAARGDTDCRLFPWGDAFSPLKCNCRKLMFLSRGKVAPVDTFPEGRSPCGCYDMSGNVWEWTASSPETDHFILKGGSCTSPSKHYLSIPARLIEHKNCINMNFGFRCCRSAD
ncbi:MAG: SUMF1/EgtB/PvdO family nonheme iron enzyme [Pseudomonadota bacterium]